MIDFPASPTTGQLFTTGALTYKYNGTAWLGQQASSSIAIPDAPNDGVQYGRQSQTWTPVAGGGGGVWIGDTPPSDTTKYPFWWSSASLQLSIWYNDGNSSQWVDTNAQPDTLQGASGPWLLADGTVAAPGLAWASEPGLGWYKYVDSSIGMAAGGHTTRLYDAGYPNYKNTTDYLYAGVANGSSKMLMSNQPFSAVNANYFMLAQNTDGSALIRTTSAGSAAVGNLTLDTPQVLHNDGTVAAPSIAFASEPGLGVYRAGAAIMRTAARGQVTIDMNAGTSTTFSTVYPVTVGGASQLTLCNQPFSASSNLSQFIFQVSQTQYSITEGLSGGATAKQLMMTFPAGIVMQNGLTLNPAAGVPTAGATFSTRAANGWAILNLDSMQGGRSVISGLKNGSERWEIVPGESTAESGGNAGSDFSIFRYSDTGAFIGAAMTIVRSTGTMIIPNAVALGSSCSFANDGNFFLAKSGGVYIHQYASGYSWTWNSANGDLFWSTANKPSGLMQMRASDGSLIYNGAAFNTAGGPWNALSDRRIKRDIRDYKAGLAAILALRPRVYKFKPETGNDQEDHIGLVFQEVNSPEMRIVGKEKVGDIEFDDMGALDTGPVTWQLVNAIKELNARLKALES